MEEPEKEIHPSNKYVHSQGLKDWMFEAIVSKANIEESAIPITINSSGVIISGTLIGVREYLSLITSPEIQLELESYSVESMKKEWEDGATLNYFHIKNAKIIATKNGSYPTDGFTWRGKISEVNGFSLAQILT